MTESWTTALMPSAISAQTRSARLINTASRRIAKNFLISNAAECSNGLPAVKQPVAIELHADFEQEETKKWPLRKVFAAFPSSPSVRFFERSRTAFDLG